MLVPPSTQDSKGIPHNGVALLLMELGCHPVGAHNSAFWDYHNEHGDKKVTISGNNEDGGDKGDADGNFNFDGG